MRLPFAILLVAAALASACVLPHVGNPAQTGDAGSAAPGPSAFWVDRDPYGLGTGPRLVNVAWAADFAHPARPVLPPASLGDGLEIRAMHFASPQVGVAFIADTDGASAHVVVYDPATTAWKAVWRTDDADVSGAEWTLDQWSGNGVFRRHVVARSWPDGSYVVAAAITDVETFSHRIWSVSSSAGLPPVERYSTVGAHALLEAATKPYLTLAGAQTVSQLAAVAATYRHEGVPAATPRVVFLTVDTLTGAPTAQEVPGTTGVFVTSGHTGVDDYFLAEDRREVAPIVTRYCRGAVCSAATKLVPTRVADFPFALADQSGSPEPWVKLADLSGVEPATALLKLPTESTEVEFRALVPDPRDRRRVRILAMDTDLTSGRGVEFLYKPDTGEITQLPELDLVLHVPCVFIDGWQTRCLFTTEWSWREPLAFFFPPAGAPAGTDGGGSQ